MNELSNTVREVANAFGLSVNFEMGTWVVTDRDPYCTFYWDSTMSGEAFFNQLREWLNECNVVGNQLQ